MKTQLIGIALFAGWIIAGSSGPYFPYINIGGLLLTLTAAILSNKVDPARLRRR